MGATISRSRIVSAAVAGVALIAVAWMVGLGASGAAGDDPLVGSGELPDGTPIPVRAVHAPVAAPASGALAYAVPVGTEDAVVAAATTRQVPDRALAAYGQAAEIMTAAAPSCRVTWPLLAAIGRVESDHGRYGGNEVGADGISRPGVIGPLMRVLDGSQAFVADSDGGEIDGDATYDRGVGPMQVLPAVWEVVGVDADGDGASQPHDIDDAALAVAVLLCSADGDLSQRVGQEEALQRLRNDPRYAALVLRVMEAYQADGPTVITPAPATAPVAAGSSRGSAAAPTAPGTSGPVHPATSQAAPRSATVTTAGASTRVGPTGQRPDRDPAGTTGDTATTPPGRPSPPVVAGSEVSAAGSGRCGLLAWWRSDCDGPTFLAGVGLWGGHGHHSGRPDRPSAPKETDHGRPVKKRPSTSGSSSTTFPRGTKTGTPTTGPHTKPPKHTKHPKHPKTSTTHTTSKNTARHQHAQGKARAKNKQHKPRTGATSWKKRGGLFDDLRRLFG